MATISVENSTQLKTALSNAQGGDTIILKSGSYGSVNFSNYKFSSTVTIKSEVGQGAIFDTITMNNSKNITIDSIEVANPTNGEVRTFGISKSSGISVINSEIHASEDGQHTFNPAWKVGSSALRISDSTDIIVKNNYIHDAEFGSGFSDINNLVVSGNKFDHLGADSMQFKRIVNGVIENNIGAANIIASTQEHVDFIQFVGSATNVVIRGNILLPKSLTYVEHAVPEGQEDGGKNNYYQGMLLKGGVFKDVTIENNLIYTNTVNGIVIDGVLGASGVVIKDNTVLTFPGRSDPKHDLTPTGSLWGTAEIRAVNVPAGSITIENNITNKVRIDLNTDTDADRYFPFSANELYVGTNLIIVPAQYAQYYENALKGLGASKNDFAIIDGSLAMTKGAYKLLALADGGDTDDELIGNGRDNIINGGAGNDIIEGRGGNDTLDGGIGDDVLKGNEGNDKLTGGEGNDTLDGGEGNDLLNGGNGDDKLDGGKGDDVISAGAGADKVDGGEGNDKLYGDAGADVINGGEGADLLHGGADDDTLNGGIDDDKLFGDEGNDIVSGGDGDDQIHGGDGNDTLDGEAGADTIYGGDGNDTIKGGVGEDKLYGEAGDDIIYGGEGNDLISGLDGKDLIFGGDGNDLLYGGKGNDTIYGGEGKDTIYGGEGDDRVRAGYGDDIIFGDTGNDWLFGRSGNDTINGGAGRDHLFGGQGADTFVFDKTALGNVDVIHDFSWKAGDKIDLSALLSDNFKDSSKLGDFVKFSFNKGDVTLAVDLDGGKNNFVNIAVIDLEDCEPIKSKLYNAVII